MALAPIILREGAHCQVRWKSNTKKGIALAPCPHVFPVCSLWAQGSGIAGESVMDSPNFDRNLSL